ncbi:uncharacterized protein LOC129911767 [Episyrphus balteatus]|uniref:uncharacterized protein LOC129911767 n=1 Tax=Episyrphus balteatus TaxID=286459 RepID=UPI0024859E30|nr:uncharacterized protein LOC129911767 [Episyrphus balteatus]
MISIQAFLVFFMICSSYVKSLPFTIDVLENRDIIFPRRSDLVKRTANNDASELNQHSVSLASFIENIETGILQTALSVDPLATDVHAEVQNTSTPHPLERRSTKEESSPAVESTTSLVLLQTTENVPAVDSVPSHVVIDRVSVFKAPEVGAGLFPTFLVQDTNVSQEATELSPDDDEDGDATTLANKSDSSDESEESTESNESSNESSEEKSKKVKTSSTTVSPSSSSTTPLSVEEKKNVEKELKEKVGEVEAEPVIFTARV